MEITMQINNDIALDQVIRKRYQRVITGLQEKGFVYLQSYSETQFPFSLILLTPIFFMMRSKDEVIRITSPLRVAAYYPLLVHRETGTIALINGLNTKYYTQFNDGTLIISVNTQSEAIHDVAGRLYKAIFPGSEVAAWEKHLEWISGFIKDGKQLKLSAGYEAYHDMSRREEKTSGWGNTLKLIITWILFLAGMVWAIIKAWGWMSSGLLWR